MSRRVYRVYRIQKGLKGAFFVFDEGIRMCVHTILRGLVHVATAARSVVAKRGVGFEV